MNTIPEIDIYGDVPPSGDIRLYAAAVMKASGENPGWTVEWLDKHFKCAWGDGLSPLWNWEFQFYRIHPQHRPKPKMVEVPWDKPEDVPLGAWFRRTDVGAQVALLWPAGIHDGGVTFISTFWTWKELQRQCQCSTDRKNWHPCTKLVEEGKV